MCQMSCTVCNPPHPPTPIPCYGPTPPPDLKLLCEMLLKVMIGKGIDPGDGGYKSWSNDSAHRVDCQRRGVFRGVWPDRNGPLPWRLTKEEVKLLDERMGRVMWPRYMDRMHYAGCSFWRKPGRLWKTKRKVGGLRPWLVDRWQYI